MKIFSELTGEVYPTVEAALEDERKFCFNTLYERKKELFKKKTEYEKTKSIFEKECADYCKNFNTALTKTFINSFIDVEEDFKAKTDMNIKVSDNKKTDSQKIEEKEINKKEKDCTSALEDFLNELFSALY